MAKRQAACRQTILLPVEVYYDTPYDAKSVGRTRIKANKLAIQVFPGLTQRFSSCHKYNMADAQCLPCQLQDT